MPKLLVKDYREYLKNGAKNDDQLDNDWVHHCNSEKWAAHF